MAMADAKLDIFKLVKFGANKKFAKGHNVFIEGSFGQEMYIVLKGGCDVSTGGVLLTNLKPGSFFGEMSLLTDLPRSATIRTSEETYLLIISQDNFTKIIKEEPLLAFKLMQVMAERIRKLNNDIKLATKQLAQSAKSFAQSSNKAHNDVLENSFYESILHRSLQSASGYPLEDVLGLFDCPIDLASVDEYGKNILGSAVASGKERKVGEAITKGVGTEVSDCAGNTPLILACMQGNKGIIQQLLARGANVNARNTKDESPLMIACIFGHFHIIPTLTTAGADAFKIDTTGNTALGLAAVYGRQECVEALIELGSNIDSTDKFGNSALLHALKAENEIIAMKLVRAGANIELKDKHGNTADSLATKNNFVNLLSEMTKLNP
jgi:ankyrin repeat protein